MGLVLAASSRRLPPFASRDHDSASCLWCLWPSSLCLGLFEYFSMPPNEGIVLWYRDGQLEVHGLKWWTTGACSPNCRIAIFMGKTDAGAAPHRQQSMVLVPMDAPGGLPRGSRSCSAAHPADARLVRARRQQLTSEDCTQANTWCAPTCAHRLQTCGNLTFGRRRQGGAAAGGVWVRRCAARPR